MAFEIITDTSANLPGELIRRLDIDVIPFYYAVNGVETHQEEDFDGPEFYNSMREGAEVNTSQIPPQRFADHMEPILKEGKDILLISMSSGISGSCSSAEIAASEMREQYPERKIVVFDTLSASLAEGIHVLEAVEMKKRGASLEETEAKLQEIRKRMYQIFTVADLKYLMRTGRISKLVAAVGTALNLKPVLKGNEQGQIIQYSRVRGRKKAIDALAEKYNELVKEAGSQTVGIAHADCPEDAQRLIDLLNEKYPPKEILNVCYEPVTGSHVGPGTLALFFMGDLDARSK
ncbi:MAG: DegV family protein [Oscillospiraceae bacterium]|nr:DegV family protein [Oscillospiraceae bacterium]